MNPEISIPVSLAAGRCVTQMGRNGLFTRDEGLKGISVLCENVNENIMCK